MCLSNVFFETGFGGSSVFCILKTVVSNSYMLLSAVTEVLGQLTVESF
jgi:hypothetical protein